MSTLRSGADGDSSAVGTPLHVYARFFSYWTSLFVLFHIQDISADNIDFRQTIPAQNGTVCPGEELQYMCSAISELHWVIGSSGLVTFSEYMELNSTGTISDFSLLLMAKNITNAGIKIISTATNDKVTSSYDGQQVGCFSETSHATFYIDIADGPANCSNMFVIAECHATTNAMGDTNFSVTLPPTSSLMCVEGYQIHFNGESENVYSDSLTANFTISDGEGQSVENEIVVYTLDYENRTGQVPCTLNISAPEAIKEILEPEYTMRTTQTVDITFHWLPPVGGGCLKGDVPFLYIVEINSSQFSSENTTSTSYTVTNITQETVIEIIISPSLPFLGLTGPPLSKEVNLASICCLTSTSAVASSIPTTSSPSTTLGVDNKSVENGGDVYLALIIGGGTTFLIPVTCILVTSIILCFRKKGKGFHKKDKDLEHTCTPKSKERPPSQVELMKESIQQELDSWIQPQVLDYDDQEQKADDEVLKAKDHKLEGEPSLSVPNPLMVSEPHELGKKSLVVHGSYQRRRSDESQYIVKTVLTVMGTLEDTAPQKKNLVGEKQLAHQQQLLKDNKGNSETVL